MQRSMNREDAGPAVPMLSKSRFLAGLQCHLRLWYQTYEPALAREISPAQQAIFRTGQEVGRVATRLYPGGVLIEEDHYHHGEAMESTLAAMADLDVRAIFEGAFLYDGVRVRADILERLHGGGWNLIEVKSAASVKEVYLWDVAIQFYVLRGSGLRIERAGILHLNSDYVYDGGELDVAGLFTFADLTEQVMRQQKEIPVMLEELKAMLMAESPPGKEPSRHCKAPQDCEFWEHCTLEMPAFWILDLTGIRQQRVNDLMAENIRDIREIPDSFPLTRLQERIRACVKHGREFVSPDLERELREVTYPVHFLDFETISPAIPRYGGTRPYETIPFQWSDHVLDQGGHLAHRQYLCEEDRDPREEFVLRLLEVLDTEGTIFIYSNYERGIIRDLAQRFPSHAEGLLATLGRIRDLQALIKRHFYHPGFHGSFSLKSVLPALVQDMDYENLAIQEGSQASYEYLRFLDPDTPAEEKAQIKENLLTYCGHDTLAMFRIREELLKRFRTKR